ncbi:hypothetical protein DXG01_000982 [Tephrocybe rancida]|nr:hypothetical protein DXG01_000982 [Tephrocybe rancida]
MHSPSPTCFGDRTLLPPTRDIIHKEEYEVEAILGHKLTGWKDGNRRMYLVQWKGYKPTEDSWVTKNGIKNAPELKSNNTLDVKIVTLQTVEKRKSEWWLFRPMLPTSEDIKRLSDKEIEFEDAVDALADLQRGVKLKEAWIEFVQRKLKDEPWSTRNSGSSAMENANNIFMGTWIIFIIHEVTELEEWRCLAFRYKNFIDGSEAEKLKANANPLEFLTGQTAMICSVSSRDNWILPPEKVFKAEEQQKSWSFSGSYVLPGSMGESGAWDNPPSDEPLSRVPSPTRTPVKPKPVNSAHLPTPLDLVTIDVAWVPWIRPPSIAHFPQGTWERWAPSSDKEGNLCMRTMTKCDEVGSYSWFDCTLIWELAFDADLLPPPGLTTDVQIFGMLMPAMSFEQLKGKDYIAVKQSRWIYPT